MLVGEAGIGKSRVAEAAARSARRRLRAAALPVLAALRQPRAASGDPAHRARRRIGAEDPAAVKLEKLSAWLNPAAEGREGLAMLAALLSIPAGRGAAAAGDERAARRSRTPSSCSCACCACRRALVRCSIIFEDLHWADPTTLEFLAALVARIDGMAALAIFTCPPALRRAVKGAHVSGRELQRLPREPALGLVEHVAGAGPDAARPCSSRWSRRADGIPLFIEELTRAVLGLGLLDGEGGPAALAGALPALAIPSTLQDSLMARLDQLGPAKFVAQLASAIGREFSYPLLDAIAPLPRGAAARRIAALEEAGLVRARSSDRRRGLRLQARAGAGGRLPDAAAQPAARAPRARSRRCWRSASRSRRATHPSCSRTTGPRRATPSAPSPAGSPPASAPASGRSTARRSGTCARASSWWSSSPTPSSVATRSWRCSSRSGRC